MSEFEGALSPKSEGIHSVTNIAEIISRGIQLVNDPDVQKQILQSIAAESYRRTEDKTPDPHVVQNIKTLVDTPIEAFEDPDSLKELQMRMHPYQYSLRLVDIALDPIVDFDGKPQDVPYAEVADTIPLNKLKNVLGFTPSMNSSEYEKTFDQDNVRFVRGALVDHIVSRTSLSFQDEDRETYFIIRLAMFDANTRELAGKPLVYLTKFGAENMSVLLPDDFDFTQTMQELEEKSARYKVSSYVNIPVDRIPESYREDAKKPTGMFFTVRLKRSVGETIMAIADDNPYIRPLRRYEKPSGNEKISS